MTTLLIDDVTSDLAASTAVFAIPNAQQPTAGVAGREDSEVFEEDDGKDKPLIDDDDEDDLFEDDDEEEVVYDDDLEEDDEDL